MTYQEIIDQLKRIKDKSGLSLRDYKAINEAIYLIEYYEKV